MASKEQQMRRREYYLEWKKKNEIMAKKITQENDVWVPPIWLKYLVAGIVTLFTLYSTC